MTAERASTDPLHVLVVSDNPSVRRELEYGFSSSIEVSFVIDAREALRNLEKTDVSAVVVDLQTGSAGGYGLARDMAADARLRGIPVLMLLDREQDDWLARTAGAKRWRVKPVGADQLMDDLTAVLA